MKFSGLAVLALLSICFSKGSATPVALGVGGTINNPAAFMPGQELTMGFTLASDTQVSALGFELIPQAFGHTAEATYSVTLTGPGGVLSWVPGDTLIAGSYLYALEVIDCGQCFPTNDFLATNFYFPAVYTQTGGTLIFQQGTTPGVGFNLTGNTVPDVNAVPEPASVALVGTGLLAAFAGMRRRILYA
jgi:hypothetical protein